MTVILFEDDAVYNFFPLGVLKPISELTLGISTLREKVERFFPEVRLLIRKPLRPLWRETLGERVIQTPDFGEQALFLNARVLCDAGFAARLKLGLESGAIRDNTAYVNGAQIAYFRADTKTFFAHGLPNVISATQVINQLTVVQTDAHLISFPWEFIRLHPQLFIRESGAFPEMGKQQGDIHPSATLVNPSCIYVAPGAVIKAGAVLDADEGFIIVEGGAVVSPNAVLMNNVYVGKKAFVKPGAKITAHVYLGERVKVGGEVEDSILESFSNKQHEGFLGHSYISHWCNLGADTNTSDLKNNYSTVRMNFAGKDMDTKMQFLGLIMGEHSKAGINTMFNTGTAVGISSNIFGSGFPPKKIGSFMWGGAEGFVLYDIEKALETARAVMKRRDRVLSESYEILLREIYAGVR